MNNYKNNTKDGYFTKFEYDTVKALFEVIIPSDNDPGANEADCVEYLNYLLSKPDMYWEIEDWRSKWRIGIKMIEQIAIKLNNKSFFELSLFDRTSLLKKLSEGSLKEWKLERDVVSQKDFFKIIRMHAIQGFLCDPRYLGNKNKIGWNFIGFHG